MVVTHDSFGNPVTLEHATSLAGVVGFAEGFLAYQPRILEVLAAAEHDRSWIVQASAAALQLFAEAPSGPPAARAHLARAEAADLPATPRERLFAQAVRHWAGGDMPACLRAHAQLAAEHPRDLAAIKLGQYHAFNRGDSPQMLRLALAALPAAADVAWVHGMAAFGYEQCHWLAEAEAAARRALAMRAAEPWAEHALAHVMLTDGRLREGRLFMRQAMGQGHWRGLTSFMRTHNAWHLALFELELGDGDAALALYDAEVWGVDKRYSQDQVGAVSLLARLEMAGVDVGPRWAELAGYLRGRTADQVQPFLDLQYLYGLARAGLPEAEALMAALRAHAAVAPDDVRAVWQQVAVPAAQGLMAHAQARAEGLPDGNLRWAFAAEALMLALPRLAAIGGSHAQRDLFEQVFIDAMQRAGRLAAVQNLLQPRANAQPQSRRLARQLAVVDRGLGLPARG